MLTQPMGMGYLDRVVLCADFSLMIGIGVWSRTRIENSNDCFAAGDSQCFSMFQSDNLNNFPGGGEVNAHALDHFQGRVRFL
jgi:hypothetical protein